MNILGKKDNWNSGALQLESGVVCRWWTAGLIPLLYYIGYHLPPNFSWGFIPPTVSWPLISHPPLTASTVRIGSFFHLFVEVANISSWKKQWKDGLDVKFNIIVLLFDV